MNKMILLGLFAAVVLIVACFFPWVTIVSKSIIVSGVASEGTYFGKPGYLHFIFTIPYILLLLNNKLWSRRVNVFICALNLTWSIRNFIVISTCQAGICPQKQPALYLVLISSIFMMIAVLFADAKMKADNP